MSLLSLYREDSHSGNPMLSIELHYSQYKQLIDHAHRNGVTIEQMAEEIINAFLSADTGSASHD